MTKGSSSRGPVRVYVGVPVLNNKQGWRTWKNLLRNQCWHKDQFFLYKGTFGHDQVSDLVMPLIVDSEDELMLFGPPDSDNDEDEQPPTMVDHSEDKDDDTKEVVAELVDDFARLHVHINLGAKWKGKRLTDNQKCYVVNLCKESHKDNVRV